MSFSHHGHYTLEQKDGYFIVAYMSSWNEESARDFFNTFKSKIEQSGFKKFGIISDLREWEGSTPEALRVGREATDAFYEKGQVAAVYLTDSKVKQQFLQQLQAIQSSRMAFKNCTDIKMAEEWMQEQLQKLR